MSRFIPETLRKKFSKSSPPPQPAARIALYPNPNPNVVALLERAFAPARNRTPFSHEDFLNRIRATEAESKATGRRWKIIDDSTAQKGTQTEKQAPQTPKQVKIPTWDPSEQPTVIMDNAPFLERCAATRRSAVTSNQETSRRL